MFNVTIIEESGNHLSYTVNAVDEEHAKNYVMKNKYWGFSAMYVEVTKAVMEEE